MRYIPALDGLRALAVTLVVASHAIHLPAGYLGVDIFFVLSGFLITGLLIAEHRETGRISILNFYIRRALRLFPCLWLMVSVTLAASWLIHSPQRFSYDASEAIFALGYIENWRLIWEAPAGNIFQHTWSLAIEEQFYIVWALTMAGCLMYASIQRVAVVISLLLIAACALCAVLWLCDISWLRIYAGSDTRAFELLAGAALASLYSEDRIREMLKARSHGISMFALAAFFALPLIACLATPVAEGKFFGVQLLTVAATVIVITDITANPKGRLASAPSRRMPVYIGSISYGIYLWHDPLSWMANEYEASLITRIWVVAGGGVALASLSYCYIERPALALKHSLRVGRVQAPTDKLGVTKGGGITAIPRG